MKAFKNRVPGMITIMGSAACALRFCLYLLATDEKGLLIPNHPLEICIWTLTAAAAVLIFFQARKQTNICLYADTFPGSAASAVGYLLFAAGICLTVLANRYAFSVLEKLRNLTGLLSIPALLFLAVCRWKGSRPSFVFHGVVCLHLVLYTTSYYSIWSRHPQLQDSFFPMMGCIFLALFSYYQTAFDVDMGSRRMQLVTGMAAVFCCIAAIPCSNAAALYLTGALWALTNLYTSTPPTPEVSNTKKEDIQ